MARFLLSRVVQAVITVLVLTFAIFLIGRVTGNPTDTLLPPDASDLQRQALTERLGLDQPLLQQYWLYISDFARGDFGTSIRTGGPVVDVVIPRLMNSLALVSVGFVMALLVGIPLGIAAAVHPHRLVDRIAMGVALIGQSVPSFLSGLLLILVFGVTLGWFPTSGIGDWRYFVLPGLTMAWFLVAAIVRLMRSSMLEILGEDYVRTARAKGLSNNVVVWRHAARNALLPVVTYIGMMFGIAIASAITTEVIFNWPGLGRLAYESVVWRDFPLLQFTVVMWALVIVTINLIVDITYVYLDPRISIAKHSTV
ncbi:ABC transporter permease [Nocardioides sp. L-11A]|uniref:ABC transporter permease n=1 Tax=Nocardioides sp. L-11A TaxID=3043848 RepID=UPI00249A18CC|nr:ABC transporter permease [Nocardioides sp. L-11A]